jgi:hypothetical protein
VQNDAAGFAAKTMFDLVETASKGQVEPTRSRRRSGSVARRGDSTSSGLADDGQAARHGRGEFDYFDYYPKTSRR